MTGLLWAAWFGHVGVMQFLMKKGSNVSFSNVVGRCWCGGFLLVWWIDYSIVLCGVGELLM